MSSEQVFRDSPGFGSRISRRFALKGPDQATVTRLRGGRGSLSGIRGPDDQKLRVPRPPAPHESDRFGFQLAVQLQSLVSPDSKSSKKRADPIEILRMIRSLPNSFETLRSTS